MNICIPFIENIKEAALDISLHDIEVTTAAEVNYLNINDEVQIKSIFTTLNNNNKTKLFSTIKSLIKDPSRCKFYVHKRNEGDKERLLISLDGYSRVVSSVIIKQLIYFFDYKPNKNSYGYRVNKGFIKGNIFESWLPSWRTFVSNIEQVISNDYNKDLIIVKADIKSFYDTIPYDNLKRQLLGDDYEKINYRFETLSESDKREYKKYIDFLFKITELIVKARKGLPQGPAYARFLAELYLDKLDDFFDEKIRNGDISFYQRYVDDIFYVTSDNMKAISIYGEISELLSKMSLNLNPDKKIIKNLVDFRVDFERYRSSSKYIVDKMSKNFFNGTSTQQNLAVNEYLKLVHSETKDDDLSFIFSHLRDVEIADKSKYDLVVPTLKHGIGRGSVFKHLFSFVLADENRWELLDEIERFTDLQSEVLMSVLISDFDNNKQQENKLKIFFMRIIDKLSITELVQESLAYLLLNFNVKIDFKKIESRILLATISKFNNGSKLQLSNDIIDYLNVDINEIRDLSEFIDILFPLASSGYLDNIDLNKLADMYFAKISIEFGTVETKLENPPLINNNIQANKLLYLICLFSLSITNNSSELLNNTWKYCVYIFNELDDIQPLNSFPNWQANLSRIEIDRNKLEYIITYYNIYH